MTLRRGRHEEPQNSLPTPIGSAPFLLILPPGLSGTWGRADCSAHARRGEGERSAAARSGSRRRTRTRLRLDQRDPACKLGRCQQPDRRLSHCACDSERCSRWTPGFIANEQMRPLRGDAEKAGSQRSIISRKYERQPREYVRTAVCLDERRMCVAGRRSSCRSR